MLVEHIINEKYINAIGTSEKSLAIKQQYLTQVWDLLQKSYAAIGGIKGNGFQTPEDMLTLPMWKMGVRGGKVHAVIIYKDKGGRKSVAIGTDGSVEGAWFVSDIFKNEMARSYGEKSKAALGSVMKQLPFDVLKNFIIPPDRVAEMFPNDGVVAVSEVKPEDWPTDAKMTLTKFPALIDFGYLRDLNGTMTFKVMIGSPGKSIY